MDYSTLTTPVLEEKRQQASDWLKANPEHPRYKEAMTRYLEILKELRKPEVERVVGWMNI